jgi:hypothetical protein
MSIRTARRCTETGPLTAPPLIAASAMSWDTRREANRANEPDRNEAGHADLAASYMTAD